MNPQSKDRMFLRNKIVEHPLIISFWEITVLPFLDLFPDTRKIVVLIYISNKMQLYTVYFVWKLLYIFRVIPPAIIRSAFNCIYSVTIRIANRCDSLYYVFISFFSSFPYMFRASMSPSSGVLQAVVFMLPFGSCSALLIVCVRQRTGLWCREKTRKRK